MVLGIKERYLAYNFVPPFILSAGFFISFLLTFQLFRLTRIIIKKGVDLTQVLELVGHIAISFIPMAVPLSVFFAIIYTLNKMSEDSEIVAMRSFGATKAQLLRPFLVLGLFIGVTVFCLNTKLIPHSKTLFKNTIIKLTSRGVLTDIRAEKFFTDIPGVILFAEKVNDDGTKMENVFISMVDKGKNVQKVIMAEKGVLVKQFSGNATIPSLRFNLTNGNIIKTNKSEEKIEKILFEEYDFPILAAGYQPGFVTKDSMRSSKDLHLIIEKRKKRLVEIIAEKNPAFNVEENNLKNRLPKSQLEYWSRINTPIQIILFIFLGFSLGIKKGRGRTKNSGILGLVFLTSYYALFFLGLSLAKKGDLPPCSSGVYALIIGHLYRYLLLSKT